MSDIHYHRQRAARELNLGLATSNIAVARAHLGLSTLHHEKVRKLEGDLPSAAGAVEPPPFVL